MRFLEQSHINAVCNYTYFMKTHRPKLSKSRRPSPLRRSARSTREPKELSVMEQIAKVTDELQMLRSRLANAGDDLPAIGTHRISALETELERLWELRRQEQAAPLRETALTEEEEEALQQALKGS